MIAQTGSRPFRWFGLLLAAWVAFRGLAILTGDPVGNALEVAPEIVAATQQPASPPKQPIAVGIVQKPTLFVTDHDRRPRQAARTRHFGRMPREILEMQRAAPVPSPAPAVSARDHALAETRATSLPPPVATGGWTAPGRPKLWSVSAWLLARTDGPVSLGTGGELGGSQAGARAFYDIVEPVAVTARVSRPLARAQGGEASVGVALRDRNVGVLFERRIALDRGGRNDFAVTGYAGVSEVPIGQDVRLDGYVQAGVVGRDGFADSAVRVERTIATVDNVRVSAGAGVWSGIQPGAQRLDVGPQIVVQAPVDGSNIRVSAEWRERVAGNAAPASGPSLTVGMDF